MLPFGDRAAIGRHHVNVSVLGRRAWNDPPVGDDITPPIAADEVERRSADTVRDVARSLGL